MYGYIGKVLFVDLTNQTYDIQDLNQEWAKDFLGGAALGARYLYDLMPANTPVFAPESVLGFVAGPTNATKTFMGGRYVAVSKSPVTGGFNDSSSGGTFGVYLRRSGFDAVFVTGISETPVYIIVDNRRVSFHSAESLWGKTTLETEAALREEIGDRQFCAALIAPGGERLSHMAAIMNDGHRAAGRGGSGAVMGSKKLKALVCMGTYSVPVNDADEIVKINKSWLEHYNGDAKPGIDGWRNSGTTLAYASCVRTSDAGIKNWGGVPDDLDFETQVRPMTGPVMDELYRIRKYACDSCPIGCGAMYHIKNEKYDFHTGRPEFETLAAFGSMLLNDDPVSINLCNHLCNEYGYDTIAFGGTIAWLMDCYEHGLFTIDELDGIDLRWGNTEAIMAMVKKMCDYEGIGIALNNASVKAAEHFGRGFEHLRVASGIELPHHGSRNNPAMARTLTYDPTPGRHVKGGIGVGFGFRPPEVKHTYEGTGEEDRAGVIKVEFDNSSGFCHFRMLMEATSVYRYMEAITGESNDKDYWEKYGLRAFTIRSAFNLREGLRRKDFTISDFNIGKPPMTAGPHEGVTVDIQKMGDNFYSALGWDTETGVPPKEFLEDVGGLDAVIKDLYPVA